MQSSSRKPKLHTEAKKIQKRDNTLLAFTLANLLLMLNYGAVGLSKAIPNLNTHVHQPMPSRQLATDTSTLVVNIIFALLATGMNQANRSKKHHELNLKAKKLHKKSRHQPMLKTMRQKSKNALRMDKVFSYTSYLLIFSFALTSIIGLVEKARGDLANSAVPDIVGSSAYLFAMLLTIVNKVLGDIWQSKIEKEYIEPLQKENSDVQHKGIISRGLIRAASFFRSKSNANEETEPLNQTLAQASPRPSEEPTQNLV